MRPSAAFGVLTRSEFRTNLRPFPPAPSRMRTIWPDTPRAYPATAPRCPVCDSPVHRHHVLDGDAIVLKCDGKLRRPGRPRCPAHLFLVGEGATCRVSAMTAEEYETLRSRYATLTAQAVVSYLGVRGGGS